MRHKISLRQIRCTRPHAFRQLHVTRQGRQPLRINSRELDKLNGCNWYVIPLLGKHRPPHHHCLESALSPCSSMRQKSFPTRWVPLLPLTRFCPQHQEVHAGKYLNNHKIKKMNKKPQREGSEIHRGRFCWSFSENASTEIQAFKYFNYFSSLNLTTYSSPRRFVSRDFRICMQ